MILPTSGQSDLASLRLQDAEDAVDEAYAAVWGAEQNGADITSLLAQLNGATDLLARAQNDYRSGAFVSAGNKANSVLSVASHLRVEALSAQNQAIIGSNWLFWSALLFSVVGCAVLVLVLFFVWRWFRGRYVRNLMDLKQVVEG